MPRIWNKIWNILDFIKTEQWLSIAALTLSALVSIIFAYLSLFSVWFYITLVSTLTASLIFDRINRHIFENKTIEKLSRIEQKMHDLECLGGIKEGLDWYSKNLVGLKSAFNTVFTRSDEDYMSVDAENLNFYINSIKSALGDGCVWTDLYCPSEKNSIENFKSSLTTLQLKNHRSYEVNLEIPMFQYTVLNYKDNRTSVIFGWGFQGGRDDKAKVFVSHSRETVDFFSDHFFALRNTIKSEIVRRQAPRLPPPSP